MIHEINLLINISIVSWVSIHTYIAQIMVRCKRGTAEQWFMGDTRTT